MRRPRRLRHLDGLKVFLTGAASGIGRATAEAAAARGARLFLTDLQEDLLEATVASIRAGGGEVVLAVAADVSDHEAVRRLARRITDEHGAMDVVMNIAGISAWGTVSSLEHETWRRQIEVNLMGPIHVIEELVPAMVDAGRGGHLVNVASAAGLIGMPWHTEPLLGLHLQRHPHHPRGAALLPSGVLRRHATAQPRCQPPAARRGEGQAGELVSEPRIAPGDRRDLGLPIWLFSRLAGRVTRSGPPNIFTTLGRHHSVFWGWLHFAGRLMRGGRLPRVDTELVILRVAAVRGSGYELEHHRRLGRRAGLSEADVERVHLGSGAPGWTDRQSLLLRVAESLLEHRDLGDDLWSELRAAEDERTTIELIMLVGHYDMLATTLTTLRVQPEDHH